jgi:hypothetical protein
MVLIRAAFEGEVEAGDAGEETKRMAVSIADDGGT